VHVRVVFVKYVYIVKYFFYTGDCHSDGYFQCANSDKCVKIIHRCDSIVDCPDGEDEPSNCATGRNKMNKQNIQKF